MKERERNISRLPLTHPQPRTWPATQACALTGNGTSDLLVCGMKPNPLNHTSQGHNVNFKDYSLLEPSLTICFLIPSGTKFSTLLLPSRISGGSGGFIVYCPHYVLTTFFT